MLFRVGYILVQGYWYGSY
ncbi:hypothetical protein LG325_00885 [Marinobacter nauticus]